MVYTTHVWWFWGWCTIVLPTLPRVMETHEYHHDPLKKQIFLHNSWLCSHVFPRNNETRGGFEFPPNKKQLQLFNHKKIFMEIFSKAPLEKKIGELSIKKFLTCQASAEISAVPGHGRYRGLGICLCLVVRGDHARRAAWGDAPVAGADGKTLGKHWENIRKH